MTDSCSSCENIGIVEHWKRVNFNGRHTLSSTARKGQSMNTGSSPKLENRKKFFQQLHRQMRHFSYQRLAKLCRRVWLEVDEHYPLEVNNSSLQDVSSCETDIKAQELLPPDAPPGLIPVKVGADGNCCPRSLSLLAYGTEESHV